jgi:glycosyltransferase involved in cell wall biosynthesis
MPEDRALTPLRVLRVLTRANVGGPARQAFDLHAAHHALGIQTLLVVGSTTGGETDLERVSHVSGTKVPLPGLTLAEALAQGPSARGLVTLPHLRRGVNPLADHRAERSLRDLIAAFAPDVVHTHMSKAGVLGRHAAFKSKVPVVAHTFHGHVLRDYFGPASSALFRRAERSMAERTQLLFAVSPSCAEELAELGVAPRERLRVVPPGLDLTRYSPAARAAARQRLELSDQEVALGFVGRLVPIKRPEMFLLAVARVAQSLGGPVCAVCIGEGPRLSVLRKHAARLSRQKVPCRILFPGVQEDLATLLPALDVLLLTSRREGCPLSAIEAFASGVPVVGLDVPGVRDILGPWGAGVLVPDAEREHGLEKALLQLLGDPDRRAMLARLGIEAAKRFQVEALAQTLSDAYREARKP